MWGGCMGGRFLWGCVCVCACVCLVVVVGVDTVQPAQGRKVSVTRSGGGGWGLVAGLPRAAMWELSVALRDPGPSGGRCSGAWVLAPSPGCSAHPLVEWPEGGRLRPERAGGGGMGRSGGGWGQQRVGPKVSGWGGAGWGALEEKCQQGCCLPGSLPPWLAAGVSWSTGEGAGWLSSSGESRPAWRRRQDTGQAAELWGLRARQKPQAGGSLVGLGGAISPVPGPGQLVLTADQTMGWWDARVPGGN